MKIKTFLTKDNWIKGHKAVNRDGTPCEPELVHGVKFCVVGALDATTRSRSSYLKLYGFLRQQEFNPQLSDMAPVSRWNDDPATTFEEVRAVLEYLDI